MTDTTQIHPHDHFDVLVIGSGPGGYAAAGRAGQLGLRTGLVERAELGGICLNWGCIPTKALLHGAEVARTVAQGASFGVLTDRPGIDIEALVQHSRSTSAQLSAGIEALMAGNQVTVIRGSATIVDKGEVEVSTSSGVRHLAASHIVVATGSHPRSLPGIEPDEEVVWTYREALVPTELPDSLVVIGSGAIGSEFASLYADLGCRVTLLEALGQIMPGECPEVSALITKSFQRRGITTAVGVRVDGVDRLPDGTARVRYRDADSAQHTLDAGKVLLAAGVQPNSTGIGLEGFDVLDDSGFIRVDQYGATGVWGLYAIGDVAGGPCLAHKATTEAVRCIDAIAGVDRSPVPPDWKDWVPRCTYTTPEVASIGLSLAKAEQLGHEVVSRPVRMAENGRALGTGQTEGFAQVLVDRDSHQILGATLVGEGVTELVGMLAVAHAGGMDADAFVKAVIPHPSRAETVHESVLAALGRPVNSL